VIDGKAKAIMPNNIANIPGKLPNNQLFKFFHIFCIFLS